MSERHEQSGDEPPPKRVTRTSTASYAGQSSTAAAAAPASLCRRPFYIGRFGGSAISYTYTPQAAAAPHANPFSRAAFAKKVVRQHHESQPAPAQIAIAGWPLKVGDEEVTKQKIGIIGAGMAGLYAALILDSLGFTNYEILEANPERAGGRVFTRYFDDITSAQRSKWSYIDFGAMRIPGIAIMKHVRSLINYLNKHTKEEHLKINLLPYYLSDDNTLLYYNSTRKTLAEFKKETSKDPLNFGKNNGGGVVDKYMEEYTPLLEHAFDSFKKEMQVDFDKGFRALMRHDQFSVRAWLHKIIRERTQETEYLGDIENLINYWETLNSATGLFDDALSEAVMDNFDFDSPTKNGEVEWKCVEGGMSQIIHALLSIIKSKPQMNKKVTKIAPSSTSPNSIDVFVQAVEEAHTYHHVINTVPPAVLRSLDTTECNFSYEKCTALRVLHVDSSVKIGLLFKSRWWQNGKVMDGKPIKGGQSSTDLPIRTIVYPSYGIDDPNAPGVLIASYVWAQDAARVSALAAGGETMATQLVQLAISNIAMVHNLPIKFLQQQYTGQYFIQDWDQCEYSQGAFALFGPGQFISLFPGLIKAEMNGRYHTAGEMASVHHAWMVGALNSAWRCVLEILETSIATQKIEELKKKWGEVDEVDMGLLTKLTKH